MGRNDDHYRNERDDQHQSASVIADELRPSTIAFIYRSEMDYISRCIHDYPNIETGGQLFGFVTEYGAPVVCYAIGPGPRANHQPTFFNQDTGYLQNSYNELNRRYGLRYIGEWHSHHQLGLAKPSGHDASTIVHGMQKNSFRHFLLCIGNCDNHFHSTLNAFTFHLDDPYNYYHAPWKIVEMESPYRAIVDRELRDVLCHPRTRQAGHGSNYILTETSVPTMITPDYSDEYWLNQKSNNLILKKIMDFLTDYEDGSTVKSMLDSQKRVHLMVQRANRQEQIVFGEGFPYMAPTIEVSEGVYVNNSTEWEYKGDVFESFVWYYKDYFRLLGISDRPKNSAFEQEAPSYDCCGSTEKEEVFIDPIELEDFVKSSELVALGYQCLDLIYNYAEDEFETKICLKLAEADNPGNNVRFYKDKAFELPPYTYIVEDLRTDKPKAFYIENDGTKRELTLKIDGKGGEGELQVTDMTVLI